MYYSIKQTLLIIGEHSPRSKDAWNNQLLFSLRDKKSCTSPSQNMAYDAEDCVSQFAEQLAASVGRTAKPLDYSAT